MRKIWIGIALASLASGGLPTLAAPAYAEEASTHYSVSTTLIGKLLDDPAAAEVMKRLIPTVYANEMFQSMGRDQTLKGVQQYETVLTDEKLAEIQAEFDKLPAKK
ncbi:MAG: hypothetical protein P0Y56_15070 [Candidatus Andeanibacterium colombiense]|uniref:Uncharacterized protein n=1 Tax=Candidatus Andeanibacterium colombiense TaxID=3121345 RepID=A0AAJ6BPF2_9SPHN|nr:MAG: hypothetical protein P0Y56_15070 [Sphingomonadaceae bacterium]